MRVGVEVEKGCMGDCEAVVWGGDRRKVGGRCRKGVEEGCFMVLGLVSSQALYILFLEVS